MNIKYDNIILILCRVIACFWMMGTIWERCGDKEKAVRMYYSILLNIENLFDSKNDVRSASPFELELNHRLAYLARERNDIAQAESFEAKLRSLNTIFNIEYNREQSHSMFFLISIMKVINS